MCLSDFALLKVVDDIHRGLTRPKYEELLVKLQLYSLRSLREDDEYRRLSKREFLIRTLEEKGPLAILG